MKYLLSIPVLILISILLPLATFVQWLANGLMTLAIKSIEFLPQIDS